MRFLPVAVVAMCGFTTSKTLGNLKNCQTRIPQTSEKVCKKAQVFGLLRKKLFGRQD
jgi:hypothetical protein